MQQGLGWISMTVSRSRGRPAGKPMSEKRCPHRWHDCFGPLALSEMADKIVRDLQVWPELEVLAGAVRRELRNALSFLGVSQNHHFDPTKTQCPYGLNCRTPSLAARHLESIVDLLVEAEQVVARSHGQWMSVGESPLYVLSEMLRSLGRISTQERILREIRERMRQARVAGLID